MSPEDEASERIGAFLEAMFAGGEEYPVMLEIDDEDVVRWDEVDSTERAELQADLKGSAESLSDENDAKAYIVHDSGRTVLALGRKDHKEGWLFLPLSSDEGFCLDDLFEDEEDDA